MKFSITVDVTMNSYEDVWVVAAETLGGRCTETVGKDGFQAAIGRATARVLELHRDFMAKSVYREH